MIENLDQILKLAIILVDAIVIITLIGTLVKGYIDGIYKYAFTSGLKWVLILIMIIFSRSIAEAILTSSYPGIGKLNEYLVELACESLEIDFYSVLDSYTYELLYGVILSVVRLIIIYLTALIVSIIIYPIIQLILRIFGIRKLINNLPKTQLTRWLGVICAVVVFGIYFAITYLPYYGSMNLALNVVEDASIFSETNEDMESVEYEDEFDLSRYVGYSFIYPLFEEEDSVAVKYLDSMFTIKLEKNKISLIEEYYNIRKLFPIIVEYAADSKGSDELTLPSKAAFKVLTNTLLDSEFTVYLLPIVVEVAIATDFFEEYNIDITLDELHDVDWFDEKETFDLVVADLNDLYSVLYDNQEDLIQVLGEAEFGEIAPSLIKNLFNLYLFEEYGIAILEEELNKYIEENDGPIVELASLIEVESALKNDLKPLCQIIRGAYILGLFEEEGDIKLEDQLSKDALVTMIDNLFRLSFIKGNEIQIVEILFDELDLGEYLNKEDLNLEDVNWETEPKKIGDVLEAYLELTKQGITEFEDILRSPLSEKLIDALVESDIFTKVLLYCIDPEIDNILSENGLEDLQDLIDLKTMSKENLKHDLKGLTKVLSSIEEFGIIDGEFNVSNEEDLQEFLNTLFDLSFVKGNEETVVDLLLEKSNISESLNGIEIEINYDNIDWDNETTYLAHLVFILKNNEDLFTDIHNINESNKDLYLDLLNTFVELDTINHMIPELFIQSLEELSMENLQSSWLVMQQYSFNKQEWRAEFAVLVDVLVNYNKVNFDIIDTSMTERAELHALLKSAVDLRSISYSGLIDSFNEELQDYLNTNTVYLKADSSVDWDKEIDVLFSADGIYYRFDSLDDLSTYQEYGKLLDDMKESEIFSSGINAIVRDYIKTLPIYKSSKNPDGVLTDVDLSDGVLNQISSWENELKLIDGIDLSSDTQSGKMLDNLMQSVLFKRQVKVYLTNKIEEENLSEYYLPSEMEQDIEDVNNRIAESKQDFSTSNDYSWEKEMNNLVAFSNKLEEIKAGNLNSTTVNELKTLAAKATITTNIYERVLEEHPEIKMFL